MWVQGLDSAPHDPTAVNCKAVSSTPPLITSVLSSHPLPHPISYRISRISWEFAHLGWCRGLSIALPSETWDIPNEGSGNRDTLFFLLPPSVSILLSNSLLSYPSFHQALTTFPWLYYNFSVPLSTFSLCH